MMNRAQFLKHVLSIGAGSLILPSTLAGEKQPESGRGLTILYTNDTHARIDPFPENAIEFAGLGGVAKRAVLINRIRSERPELLLLDAGDVFQGTPWFNVYGGTVDFRLMTQMKYDACAIGNHEFDKGLDWLADTSAHAGFPLLAANYAVRNTPLNDVVQKFTVIERNGVKTGIFGLGIRLDGVVKKELYGNVQHRDPVIWADGMVNSLRNYHRCDYVICLSHLGYSYPDKQMDDLKLAAKVNGIDLIIGGHTHTFLDQPVSVANPDGGKTIVTQAGHSGIRLGRIDLDFTEGNPVMKRSVQYVIGAEGSLLRN